MEAPKLPSFIRQNQHRRFEYAPRFYNERKERLEEMRKKYGDQEGQAIFSGESFRMRVSTEWRNSDSRKKSGGTGFRLVIIVAALVLISYLILFY